MSRAVRRPDLWFGTGVLIAVLIAALAIGWLTRTDRGRAEILAYTLTALGGRLNGTLTIERLDGNVLTGARLYGITLRGADDHLLLRSDSGYIEYQAPTLIGGDVVIRTLVLYRSELFLRRLPGDTLWNYQAILQDTTPDPDRDPRATLIERLRLVDAEVDVRVEWEPEDDLPPAQRAREIEAALSDTSRLVVERVPGGYVRHMSFEVQDALASDVVVSPDERGGTFLRVESARGDVYLWREPALNVADLQGELTLQDGVVRYEADRIAIGRSAVSSGGTVDLTGDEPRYDIFFSGENVRLADLQWLYPWFPDAGSLDARLWVETRPEGLYILVRDGLLDAPDTRITGDFGMVTGDTLRFTEVDLRAAPLNVETVERLLPMEIPVRGLRIGSVVIESPEA